MDFNGERFIPVVTDGDIELEHNHRYLLAADLVAGKQVLDIASGEGYGSALMAQSAARVTGVDIDPEAVNHAKNKYQSDNLSFMQGDCANIPMADHSVDAVVSFETIEHHTEHEQMMLEIKRVLRPGGLLIISSPDKKEYSDVPGQNNHFHVRELYRDEFEQLVAKHFKNFSISGQRIIYGSLIGIDQPTSHSFVSFQNCGDSRDRVDGVPRAVYLIALASDQALPELPNSSYSSTEPPYQRLVDQFAERDFSQTESRLTADGTIAPEFVDSLNKVQQKFAVIQNEFRTEVQDVESKQRETESSLQETRKQLELRDSELHALQSKNDQLSLQLAERQQVASAALEREQAMLVSKSWRITSPLRSTRRSIGPDLFHSARRSVATGGKRAWALIPLSNRQRREAKT